MKVNFEQKRLKAVKSRFRIFPTKCECCGEEFYFEKMWSILRWGINETCHNWYYCKKCMHSADEVLNEVDTDECPWGIAVIDPFLGFSKKDNTRLMNRFNEFKPRPRRSESVLKTSK